MSSRTDRVGSAAPIREYPFGWAYRWTNAGGDPMVNMPESHFDALTVFGYRGTDDGKPWKVGT